jgi:RNA polymerase sigma-B factor
MTIQPVLERPAIRRRPQPTADLMRAQQTGDHFLRLSETTDPVVKAQILDEIVLVNLPVADRLARRYSGRGIASQDLVQVARLALVQAVRRFDPSAGFDFLSFAVPTILGELKRHFRDRGWAVRPPRRLQELRPRVLAATAELIQTLQRTPTRAEVADYLGVDASAIGEALMADGCFAATSLDRPVVQDSRASAARVDVMGHDDPSLEWVEVKLMLAPIFRKLSDRDRLVLRLRFVDDLTQQEIGGLIGVTQMQVSRILARIMRLARGELAA